MKILHVCPLYFPSLGGNQIHVQSLSERLAALGEEVHVFTAKVLERYQFATPDAGMIPLKEYEVSKGVHIHRFPISHFLFSLLFKKLIKVRGGYRLLRIILGEAMDYWGMGPCVSGMLESIGRLKPDIVLAVMENSFTTYLCYQAKRRFNIPFVFMPITHIADRHGQKICKDLHPAARSCRTLVIHQEVRYLALVVTSNGLDVLSADIQHGPYLGPEDEVGAPCVAGDFGDGPVRHGDIDTAIASPD